MHKICEYYRARGFETEGIAASLRSVNECVHLAGVELITINIGLLGELRKATYTAWPVLQDAKGEVTSTVSFDRPWLKFARTSHLQETR